jgi:DNA polymerase-3 subunit gamma/tau
VPVTVLSRCQRFDLRRIDSETLAAHFANIAAQEQATAEPEAIKMIAHAADGSVRDGLSLLDQAIARGNGNVTTRDVKDMLGLADRGQSIALCRHILRGQISDALDIFIAMQQAGSDPLQVLQDMCDLVHLLTRGQVVSAYAVDAALAEYDRQLLTELCDIKIPPLARAWQILLKGIQEVQAAAHPAQAAEMVLIRLAYAADLPTPGELVRQLKENGVEGRSARETMPPSGGGSRAKLALGVGMGGGGHAVLQAETVVVEAPGLPQPGDFRELVALFSEHREAGLHAQLYGQVHLVRCEAGHLEIRVGKDSPANLAGRIGQCLTEWTGQRWVVSISAEMGAATLYDQDRAAEVMRHERAHAHPLVQAVIKAFPNAKMTALRQRTVAIPVAASDDVPAISDSELLLNDSED